MLICISYNEREFYRWEYWDNTVKLIIRWINIIFYYNLLKKIFGENNNNINGSNKQKKINTEKVKEYNNNESPENINNEYKNNTNFENRKVLFSFEENYLII